MLPAMNTTGRPTPAGPHRRYNPLLDEWVLVSPHRLARPWQGQVEAAHPPGLPAHDPDCYLCPRNRRAGGEHNPDYRDTFVFDNDFPALLPPVSGADGGPDDLLHAEPQSGICRVVCFSPRHDLTLARMDMPGIRKVIEAWTAEVERFGRRGDIGYVQVFENKGTAMGCSNPHPHGQIWGSAAVPHLPARKMAMQRRYFERHGRDLLGDYLLRELAAGERVVCRNEAWVVVVPFWAVWPFETMVVPVRAVDSLPALTSDEREGLADILRRLTVRYDNLFACSFPYSMGWHGRPTDGQSYPGCRLHAVYFPPLLRSADVRKFLVGYEMTAEPQRDLTAESAAERLRAQSETHYLIQLSHHRPE
ncbi:MAG: UDP-glucose--hexose-1-phosphate uridylyltransferase [Acidobacteria bacterium]|nr:UDP-glucose--hexose-1-phosphate uridylyltransferase [Acidobacteriota bacterium]